MRLKIHDILQKRVDGAAAVEVEKDPFFADGLTNAGIGVLDNITVHTGGDQGAAGGAQVVHGQDAVGLVVFYNLVDNGNLKIGDGLHQLGIGLRLLEHGDHGLFKPHKLINPFHGSAGQADDQELLLPVKAGQILPGPPSQSMSSRFGNRTCSRHLVISVRGTGGVGILHIAAQHIFVDPAYAIHVQTAGSAGRALPQHAWDDGLKTPGPVRKPLRLSVMPEHMDYIFAFGHCRHTSKVGILSLRTPL